MCNSCEAMTRVLKFLLEDLNSTLCGDTVEIIEHTLSQCDEGKSPTTIKGDKLIAHGSVCGDDYQLGSKEEIGNHEISLLINGEEVFRNFKDSKGDVTVMSPVPEYALEYVKENWPGVHPLDVLCECQKCDTQTMECCDLAFDPYSLYTADGKHTNTGPLCLK